MNRDEIIALFLRQKVLIEEQGKIVLALNCYPKPLNANKIEEEFEKLLQDYSELWPKGVKSGGRLIRKTPSSLKAKLKAFTNRRRDLSFKSILDGTEAYLRDKRAEGWEYTISSDYFILKNGASELESYAELAEADDLPTSGSQTFVTGIN